MLLFFYQGFEYRQALLDQFIADAVADPEVTGAAEAVTGYQQQILLLGLFGKCHGIAAGGFDKQVEGTVGLGHFVAHGGESLIERTAVPVIAVQIRPQMGAAGDDLLPQTGSADMAACPGGTGNGGVHRGGIGGLLGHINIADPFAGEGQGLGVGIADDGIGVDIGDEGSGAAVGQLPVGLVRDDVNGMAIFCSLPGQNIAQCGQRFCGVDNTRGIVGGIDDYSLGVFADCFFKGFKIHLEILFAVFHNNRGHTRLIYENRVFGEERCKDNDFALFFGNCRK